MVPLQKRYFAINCPKNVSAIVIREHEVFAHRQNTSRSMFSLTPRRYSPTSLFKGFSFLCRGGPVCPPVSMISFDFGKTTAKMTFLQCNHIIIDNSRKGSIIMLFQLKKNQTSIKTE